MEEARWPDAEREAKAAGAVWDSLVRKNPEISRYRWKTAVADRMLGDMYRNQNLYVEAEDRLAHTLAALERLTGEEPEVIAYQEELELDGFIYSRMRLNNNSWETAAPFIERAVAVRERLAQNNPKDSRHQKQLGHYLSQLGHAFAWKRKFPEAVLTLTRSIAILERLASDHPNDMSIASKLAGAYEYMADIHSLQGDFELLWCGRAVRLKSPLRGAARSPQRVSRPGESLESLAGRAEILMPLGAMAKPSPPLKRSSI